MLTPSTYTHDNPPPPGYPLGLLILAWATIRVTSQVTPPGYAPGLPTATFRDYHQGYPLGNPQASQAFSQPFKSITAIHTKLSSSSSPPCSLPWSAKLKFSALKKNTVKPALLAVKIFYI